MNGPKRITIPVSPEEVEALRRAAAADLRDPRDQARYILRTGLGLPARPLVIDLAGGQSAERRMDPCST